MQDTPSCEDLLDNHPPERAKHRPQQERWRLSSFHSLSPAWSEVLSPLKAHFGKGVVREEWPSWAHGEPSALADHTAGEGWAWGQQV